MLSSGEEEGETPYEEGEETKILNAEKATLVATNFLRRLGNPQGLKPLKASLQEGTYIVEIGMKNKTATVQVDANNGEIKEYEIKTVAKETTSSFPLTRKNILIICGIVVVSIFVSSLLGIQSFFSSLF